MRDWLCPKPHFVARAVVGLRPGERVLTGMNVEGTDCLVRHRTPMQARAHDEMGFTAGWGVAADRPEALVARPKD